MADESILNLAVDASLEICYGETFGSEDIRLLEVDESILSEVLDRGVFIRGGLNDEAVLCTSTTTYAIKFVMTSNTVLVMPPPKPTAVVGDEASENHENKDCKKKAIALAAATGHLELVEISPNLEKLRSILSQHPYKEEVDAMAWEEDAQGLYTWDDLLDTVQASEKQLREGLKALAAVQIGDFWRLVDDKFMQCLLEVIILNAIQHDWSLSALRADEVLPVLNKDGYSAHIVKHCLATYGRLICSNPEHDSIGSGEDVWELDQRQICLHYAKQLLAAGSKWRLEDFLDAWQQNLPTGMQCNLEMLRGEALVEKLGSESWLRPFSVSSLPSNPAERFLALFRERPKWEWQDLEPYVSDLRAPGKSVEVFLLKYTRKTQPTADAMPIFTAR